MPEPRSVLQLRRILGAQDSRSLSLTEDRGVRRVVERAQHARDVAQCAAFDPPLAQRPRRLAFEVDDHEVVARPQHLSEVIVAVRADAETGDSAIEDLADVFLQIALALEQLLAFRLILRSSARQLQRLHGLLPDELIDRSL